MVSLPTHLSSTCDSVKNNYLLNYHVEGPFVRVGATNRDKRVILLSGLVLPTGIKGLGLLSRVEPPTGTKGGPFVRVGTSNRDKRLLSPPPPGPANRWTRDKSHLLSRVQRQPGQMAWNKDLFCSSESRLFPEVTLNHQLAELYIIFLFLRVYT